MKTLKVYLIIAGFLLVFYLVAQFNRPKVIDWSENLSTQEKTPFGAFLLKERLGDIFPGSTIKSYRQPVYNVIADDSVKNSTYIIISSRIQLSKADVEQLIKYIKQGNDVFIASEYFAGFEKYFKIKTAYDFKIKNQATSVNFVNKYLRPERQYTVNKGTGSMYFTQFDTLKSVVLGETTNHKANYIKINFDKGSLYLLTNPKFFSNYSLLQSQGAEYAGTALSYLKNTRQILLDEYYTQGNGESETPMRLFLSKQALQWAYYTSLFTLLVFVLYEIKRRQRIIPVIEPLTNSTLEFTTVVGQLYYEKRNNADIAQKKIVYFLAFLRDQYYLKVNKPDDDLLEALKQKLNIDSRFADKLVQHLVYINEKQYVDDKELIQLNRLIEQFYAQTK